MMLANPPCARPTPLPAGGSRAAGGVTTSACALRLPPRGSRRQAVQRLFDMCWRHFLTEIGAPEHSDTLVLYPGFWTPPNPLAPWSCTVESSKQDGSSLCDGEKEI